MDRDHPPVKGNGFTGIMVGPGSFYRPSTDVNTTIAR
jgi:hypothetical protein